MSGRAMREKGGTGSKPVPRPHSVSAEPSAERCRQSGRTKRSACRVGGSALSACRHTFQLPAGLGGRGGVRPTNAGMGDKITTA
jgi:hypothetical protein